MPLTAENVGHTDANKSAVPNATHTTTNGASIRVLAIDDNEEFRNLITELLQPLGFDVVAVANPVKALEKFTQEKDSFQLVLLDYYMPQLDGAKTFEWLKKLNPNVRVIIVSGAEELRLRQILAQHPIDGYIRKPFRIQEAIRIIHHVMSKPGAKPTSP
ncbi:MAG TPA: response regulator [Verrucomicrobiae bacterium]|nr:response regulator [Verrucomicrobiae bacterium]